MRFARLPGAEWLCAAGLWELFETRPGSSFRRGVIDPATLTDDTIREYLRPLRGAPEKRRRFLRFVLAGNAQHTLSILPRLREFRRPTMVLWAEKDTFLPVRWGQRLYETIPGAVRFEVVPGAGHFWPRSSPPPLPDTSPSSCSHENQKPKPNPPVRMLFRSSPSMSGWPADGLTRRAIPQASQIAARPTCPTAIALRYSGLGRPATWCGRRRSPAGRRRCSA